MVPTGVDGLASHVKTGSAHRLNRIMEELNAGHTGFRRSGGGVTRGGRCPLLTARREIRVRFTCRSHCEDRRSSRTLSLSRYSGEALSLHLQTEAGLTLKGS